MQEPRDDRDLTDNRVDPHDKARVAASTMDLCAENKARVATLDIGFCQTLYLHALVYALIEIIAFIDIFFLLDKILFIYGILELRLFLIYINVGLCLYSKVKF